MPIFINEDAALKKRLGGITVSDSGNATRPVPVFYGQPDKDIRNQTYPYITVDLIGISEDRERAHRGYVPLTYKPEGMTYSTTSGGLINQMVSMPIPLDIYYQVSTWARQPRHDRQILSVMLDPARIPYRFGQLYIPEDNTWRRMDLMGFSKRDTNEGGKRLFSNVYNIRVSAEVFTDEFTPAYQVTQDPNIALTHQTTVFTAPTNPA
jgi:hypothetical protein